MVTTKLINDDHDDGEHPSRQCAGASSDTAWFGSTSGSRSQWRGHALLQGGVLWFDLVGSTRSPGAAYFGHVAEGDSSAMRTAAGEVVSNVVNEAAKTMAMYAGMDPMSAAAIGGAAAGMSKTAEAAFARLVERRRARVETALRATGRDAEHLLVTAMDDDRKLELLGRALEVAQRTVDEERVRFYGRIAAEGVLASDTAVVDEKDRIFSGVAALDPADLKVLLLMVTDRAWQKRVAAGQNRVIADELPEVANVLDAIFARLENLGMITGQGEGGLMWGNEWTVTDFGRLCVDELRRLGVPDAAA